MTPSQLITSIVFVVIVCALGYLAWLWAWPMIAKGLYFGAMVAFFLVWVVWCVVKP